MPSLDPTHPDGPMELHSPWGTEHGWAAALGCVLELCLNPHFSTGLCINNTDDEQAVT